MSCQKSISRRVKEENAQEENTPEKTQQSTDSQQKAPDLQGNGNTQQNELLAYFFSRANTSPCLICTLYDLPLPFLLLLNHKEYTRERSGIRISVILISEATKK